MITTKATLDLSSPAFPHEGLIAEKYTCDGQNLSPPLRIEGIPEKTQSLVLVMEDPDAPGRTFTHWLAWNIPPTVKEIPEGHEPEHAILGMTDFGKIGYGGPCPPTGEHRYYFRVFALNITLPVLKGTEWPEVHSLMDGHVLAEGILMGRYRRAHAP